MTDEAAFLRTIIERPDDDVPRRVFADWLDEHGQPERAEFCRVQCELATMPQGPFRPAGSLMVDVNQDKRDALRRRERELLRGVLGPGVDLLPVVDGLTRTNFAGRGGYGWYRRSNVSGDDVSGPGIEAQFIRGFVSAVTLSWDDWRRHGDALLSACPIRNARDGVVRLTSWPEYSTHADGDSDSMIFRLVGCRAWASRRKLPNAERRTIVDALLAAEFPGVAFELPAAGGGGRVRRVNRDNDGITAEIEYTPDGYEALRRLVTPEARP